MFVTTVTTGRLQATPEIPTVGTATMRATTFSLMSPIRRGPRPRRDFETSSRTDCDEAADKVSVGPSLEVGLESSLWAMTSPRLALHNGLMQDLPSIKEVPEFADFWSCRLSMLRVWVLRIAKVGYFFLPSLPNVEWPILGPLPFLFYQKLFIFRFLENCFWGPNLHNAVG